MILLPYLFCLAIVLNIEPRRNEQFLFLWVYYSSFFLVTISLACMIVVYTDINTYLLFILFIQLLTEIK